MVAKTVKISPWPRVVSKQMSECREIWKFPLELILVNAIDVPGMSRVVFVAMDHVSLVPAVWVEVDPTTPTVRRKLHVVGTGQSIPAETQYFGTAIDREDGFVWHIYG